MPEHETLHVVGLPPEPFEPMMVERLPGRVLRGFADEDDFAARVGEVEILLALRPPRGHWARAERLRMIQISGAGVDALLPAPDLPEGIRVANGRGISGSVMAEYALGWMLHFARRVPRNQEQQARREFRLYAISMLEGATCGILGMGAIGEAVAHRAKAFGMRVLGTQRTPRPSEHADEVLGLDGTERVLAESDYVVVILPLTPETRGLLGEALLSKLRPEAVLVNMARGGIVDEPALAAMLEGERLRGAVLDVFEEEPLPASSPLWSVPNLVVTPHVAGFRRDYLRCVFDIFAARGFEDAKMQEIAAEAGVSLGTVYGVFPGKAELYRAVHDHRLDAMQARAEAASPAGAPVLRRLLDGIAAYVGFLVEHPDFLRIHLRDGGAWGVGSTLAGGEPLAAWARGQALQIELLREGIAEGTFVDDDPELLSRTIVAMQQVQLAAWVERGMREPAEPLVARMQAQLERAFVRPEARAADRGAVA